MFCCVLAVVGSQAKRTLGEELPEKSLGFSKQREGGRQKQLASLYRSDTF